MNLKRWLVAISLFIVIVAALGTVKFGQIQQAIAFAESFPEPSATVKSTIVEAKSYTQTTKVIGQVQAIKHITISNEYGGKIVEVGFQPGDIVENNQILLRIDDSVEQASLIAANARLKLAKLTYKRHEKLLKQNRISRDEVDRAEAEVSIAKSEVDNLQSILDKKVIRAPFAGRVGLEQFEEGELIGVNSLITSLVGIDQNIRVSFSIPQSLPQLKVGDEVTVSSAEKSHLTQEKTAIVIAKQPSLDINSRQQSYLALVDNSDNVLSHNQIVAVYAPTKSMQVVVVPTNSITRDHFGDYVQQLVKDDNNNFRAKPIKVELGDKVNNNQIVLSGLEGGELIASEGAFKLAEGLLVYTKDQLNQNDQQGEF